MSRTAESRPLARYQQLVKIFPQYFSPVGDHGDGELELITDEKVMKAVEADFQQKYEHKMDQESAFVASRVGVILEDPYWIILREAVLLPDGNFGLFDRYLSTSCLAGKGAQSGGGMGLPLLANGNLLLVREFRHQERSWRLGLPGGFRDPGEGLEAAVRREVEEETGFLVTGSKLLGRVDVDFESAPMYLCYVEAPRDKPKHSEPGEAIDGVVELGLEQVRAAILAGKFVDSKGREMVLHGPLATAIILLESEMKFAQIKN